MIDLEADEEEGEGFETRKTTEYEDEEMVHDDNSNEPAFDDGLIAAALEEEEQGRTRRPRRERKKPKLLYNPLEWRDKSVADNLTCCNWTIIHTMSTTAHDLFGTKLRFSFRIGRRWSGS